MNRKQRRLAAKQEKRVKTARSAGGAATAAWELALRHHGAGRLAEAERLYRQVLQAKPDHADAQINLGVALQARGRIEEAAAAYRAAVVLRPERAEAHGNLGNVLRKMGRMDEAVAAHRAAVELKPDFAEAHSNLGNALGDRGDLDEAVLAHRRAVALRPSHAGLHRNLGVALRKRGRPEEAIVCFRRCLEIQPGLAQAQVESDWGDCLKDQGRLEDATARYRRALAIDPAHADALNGLGNALMEQERLEEVVTTFEAALASRPDHAGLLNNLGHALERQQCFERAIACFQRAIAADPRLAEAHNNLGNVLRAQGRLDEAIARYEQATALKPDDARLGSNLLLTLQYAPAVAAGDAASRTRAWARRFESRAGGVPEGMLAAATDPDPERGLRIGYVSGDFLDHPVGFFLERVLAARDPDRTEVICYANQRREDALTGRLRGFADGWRDIAYLSGEAAAAQVREDAIDILVDLSGHTRDHRLDVFARRPAPLQATWLGYCATTGLESMDYIVADRHVIPPGEEGHYSEAVLRLPDSYLCFSPPDLDIPVARRPPAAGGPVTFGCFNSLAKITPDVVALWARILAEAPDSRLFLKTKCLDQASVRARYKDLFARHGIGDERLILEGPAPREALLRAYNRVDIALDPFPYNGGTTSVEALWMGVPIVTLRGDRFAGRVGTSILTTAGLGHLVAGSEEDYRARAVALAAVPDDLAELRCRLRSDLLASPLCDGPAFARGLDAAYRDIWRGWCRGRSQGRSQGRRVAS